jgi:general secretion pathway protein H
VREGVVKNFGKWLRLRCSFRFTSIGCVFSRKTVDDGRNESRNPSTHDERREIQTAGGFTLIELIIVLIVLAAVLTITFPRMEGFFSGGYLKSTSRRLVGTIRYLHDRAATTGKRLCLCYDLDENEYWIEEENEEGEFEELKTVLGRKEALPAGIEFLDIITPEGKINSGQTLTLFFPQGYVTKSIIHLQNEKEEVQTLLVKGSMGQVTVYEEYVEEE